MGSGASINEEQQNYVNGFVKAAQDGNLQYIINCVNENAHVINAKEVYRQV